MERVTKMIRILGLPAVIIVSAFLVIAIFGAVLRPYDPNAQSLMNINESFAWAHPLGTDHLGRDTLSRLIAGAQTTLIGVTIILIMAGCLGLVIGTISGYFGGWIDEILMRIVDFGLSVPSLVVALAIVGVFGPSYWNMIIALALAWVPIYARLTRGAVASAVNQPHIESLWVLGASRTRIISKHLAPVALGSVLIYASADAGMLALAIANLSFLGLGVQPPQAEWGQMLVSALPYLEESPRQVILPGLALTIMVVGFNLLGEAIALAKNPKPLNPRVLTARRKQFQQEALA
ncbi:ABC transporter permease [Nordella sp. HKS 07]|uniref:ABC transporter permease n=1 Tax=Nordella sp. HKS 07 TaxID=2712222 RepID=UPI0013E1A358|nr:ABC transporter permease [Nordella sp. HKS 07]QIG46643.1 ABC transporter permease [Nordella sp. HKS 07]